MFSWCLLLRKEQQLFIFPFLRQGLIAHIGVDVMSTLPILPNPETAARATSLAVRSSCEFVRTPMELFPLCAYWLLGKDLWKSQPLFHSGISHRCPSRVKPCLLLDRRTSCNNSKRRVSKGPPTSLSALCHLTAKASADCAGGFYQCLVSKFCKEPFFLSSTHWCLPQYESALGRMTSFPEGQILQVQPLDPLALEVNF